MKELAMHLKLMNAYAHAAHNLVSRVPFFQDHDFFGVVYGAYDTDYDAVVERIIGLQGDAGINLKEVQAQVADRFASLPLEGVKENSVVYATLLQLEQELCKIVAALEPKVSSGTSQLIGEMCNQSEMRQYKIKRRLMK